MAQCAFEDIADTFEFLEDWEDRYRHVIDLGKAMPPLDENQKSESVKIYEKTYDPLGRRE